MLDEIISKASYSNSLILIQIYNYLNAFKSTISTDIPSTFDYLTERSIR